MDIHQEIIHTTGFYAHYAGGKDKFSYKLEKKNNKNVKSQLIVDLFVI